MRRWLQVGVAMLSLALCGAGKPPAKKTKAPTAASTAKTLLQMEREWSQAGISKDIRTMDRILADDWVSIDFRGKATTKSQAMAELKSGSSASQGMETGDMKVRVLGDTAIITGSDSSGAYTWMDVFMKRNGRWQAVASQSTKVEK